MLSYGRALNLKRAKELSKELQDWAVEEYLKNEMPLVAIALKGRIKFRQNIKSEHITELVRERGFELRPLIESRKIYSQWRSK